MFQFKKSSFVESVDGILITDYQNGEQINYVMNVGLSEADWVSQGISVSYDADADQTNVSIKYRGIFQPKFDWNQWKLHRHSIYKFGVRPWRLRILSAESQTGTEQLCSGTKPRQCHSLGA